MPAPKQQQHEEVQRLITPHDLAVARRLKAIYFRKKEALHLTQEKLSKATGYKQATISCHMNGHIALRGVRGITAYASALEVAPDEIDPRFKTRFQQALDPENTIPMPGVTLYGEEMEVECVTPNPNMSRKAYLVGSEYLPVFPPNTKIIVDTNVPISKNAHVIIATGKRAFIAILVAITQRSVTYRLPPGMEDCTSHKQHHKEMHDDVYYPTTNATLPLKDTKGIARVIAIELP